ncbi:MAG: NAD(P)H-quinone oxidoreductase [Segniliparus sp.]|uniref:NAD(P)H-quinone oxidoreductase n=1 Tax=Segniliparus sp. TaxID=2804064 RepID=UPI003F318F91
MKAIALPSFGGPEAMVLADVARPEPGPQEVLVEVVAAGVNRADLLQRQGFYPPPPGASDILGLEVSGRIVAVGDEVTSFSEGDEVCALLPGGGYAQYAVAHQACVLPVPPGVALVEAAGLPETAATVWLNLGIVGGLAAGDRVLVHGGASGIGTHAIQVAAAFGAEVAATASREKADRCKELGARIVIDYKSEDFAEVLRERWPNGATFVLDHIGGPYLGRDIDVLATDGKIVVIGSMGGGKAEINLLALLAKRASVIGSTLRNRPVDGPVGKAEIIRDVREHVWPLIAAGKVKPVIGAQFPVADVAGAHRALAEGSVFGKALLTF